MRSEQEVNRAMERHADTVRRLCLIHLKNHADTEDIFQNVFLKYALSSVRFESEEHERAWFIRVTLNACRDLLRRFFRSRTVSLEKLLEQPAQIAPDGALSGEITISEGKFHQIKRMFAAVGCKVVSLERISFGPLKLDPALGRGEWRYLTEDEISSITKEESV
mgnify:CR=1 FL=1